MATHKGQQPKGKFRSLKRMLSFDALPREKEGLMDEQIGQMIGSERVDEGHRLHFGDLRRMSLTNDLARGDEARVKLVRLKSYPPPPPPPLSSKVEVELKSEGPVAHLEGDVILCQKMGETSIGRTLKTVPPPPIQLRGNHSQSANRRESLKLANRQSSIADKKMEELLECAVCLERLRDPRTLPCDHTFCLVCLKIQVSSPLGALDGNAGIIKCPTCRKESNIPRNGGISSFPVNVYLDSLLQILADRGGHSPKPLPSSPPPLLSPTNGCSKCGNSGNLHLYICGHCHQVLCNQCLPGHFSELKDKMESIHEQIKEASLRLEEAEKEFSERFGQLRSQVEAETELRLAQVRQESDNLLARIKALESKRQEDGRSLSDRLGQFSGLHSTDAFENSAAEGKVEIFIATQTAARELTTEASQWSEEVRFPLTFDRTTFRILDPGDVEDEEEADTKVETDDELDEVDEEVEWKKKEEGRRNEVHREVSVRIAGRTEDRRREGGDEHDKGRRRSAARALPTNHDELSLYYRSRSVSSARWTWGSSKGTAAAGELYRPAGLGVAPWRGGQEMYVAASDGGRVSVFTRRSGGNGWKHSRTLSSPPPKERMLCPFGIAFSETRGEVYITDKWCHCIHVYDAEGTWIRRLCKPGRSPGFLSSPEGIAATDNHIFVADTGNDRVQVLNAVDGTFVAFVGSELASYKREKDLVDPSPGSGYLMQPTGVALTADESKLVVCDSGHNRIKVFDITGLRSGDYTISNKPTCVFGSLGSQRGQLRSARGIAVDRLGFVVVADSGNSRIQIFRPNGMLVRAFGSKGKEQGQFGYPSAVHVGPFFELYVSDATNHCVSIF